VTDAGAAAAVVADLEHIARWRQIKALGNPLSSLAGAVALDVVAAHPGEPAAPFDRAPLPRDGHGAIAVAYRAGAEGWIPPEVYVRLRNTTDRWLYCVLLDLTDRFRVHPGLFPGDWIGPGLTTWAAKGDPIALSLPPGRPVEPGARGTDWLKLLVAEAPFSAAPFELGRLGEPSKAPGSGRTTGIVGVLDRLGLLATRRGVEAHPPAAHDWSTAIVPLVTHVPEAP